VLGLAAHAGEMRARVEGGGAPRVERQGRLDVFLGEVVRLVRRRFAIREVLVEREPREGPEHEGARVVRLGLDVGVELRDPLRGVARLLGILEGGRAELLLAVRALLGGAQLGGGELLLLLLVVLALRGRERGAPLLPGPEAEERARRDEETDE